MVRDNRIKSLNTGTQTATATLTTNYSTATDVKNSPVNGLLQAVRVVLDPSADIEIYNVSASGTTPSLLVLASGTDLIYPRVAAISDGGGAITDSAVEYVLKGDIGIDVTNIKNGSTALVELWYK